MDPKDDQQVEQEDLFADEPEEQTIQSGPEEDIEVEIVDDDGEETEAVAADSEEGDAAPAENPVEAAKPDTDAAEADVDEELDEETREMRQFLRPKFKKRLDREIRSRREAQQQTAAAIRKAAEWTQYSLTKETELATAKHQLVELQVQYAESLETTLSDRAAARMAEIRKAREEGEYDNEIKLQSDLDDLRYKLRQVKDAKMSLAQQVPVAQQAVEQQKQKEAQQKDMFQKFFSHQQQAQQQRATRIPLAEKWLHANQRWFTDRNYEVEKAGILAIDAQVAAEGLDKNSPDYYRELDKRIDSKFPHLRKRGQARTGSPVAPVSAAPASAPSSGGKTRVTVTRADLSAMQRFGLDPNNKEHIREFVRQRRPAA